MPTTADEVKNLSWRRPPPRLWLTHAMRSAPWSTTETTPSVRRSRAGRLTRAQAWLGSSPRSADLSSRSDIRLTRTTEASIHQRFAATSDCASRGAPRVPTPPRCSIGWGLASGRPGGSAARLRSVEGGPDRRRPRVHAELRVRVFEVPSDRPSGDPEPRRDLRIRQALRHEPDDLVLATRQPLAADDLLGLCGHFLAPGARFAA